MVRQLLQQLQGVLSTKDSVETAKVCRAIVEEGVRTICQRLGKEAKPTTGLLKMLSRPEVSGVGDDARGGCDGREALMNRREFMKGGIAAVSVAALAGCGKNDGVTGKEGNMAEKTFNELIEARRSVRRYAPSEITKDELATIVAEALNAPSWKNNEETRYHIALSSDAKNALWKEALPSFNAANSANAAALVVVTFKKGLSGFGGGQPVNELGDMWGAYDAGLASSYFVLAAKNHGWDTLIMGIRDAEAIRRVLSVPEDEIVTAVIALGKSAQPYFKNPRKAVDEVMSIS